MYCYYKCLSPFFLSSSPFVLHDGQNVIEEYTEGTLRAQYVHEYGLDSLCQIASRDSTRWYHKDLVQSVRLLTGEDGRSAGYYTYTAFGQPLEAAPGYNPYQYMGRRYDAELDAYDFRTRQYSPELGRFFQRDTIPAANPYLFVENDPLGSVDPMGRERQPTPSFGEFQLQLDTGEVADYLAEESAKLQEYYASVARIESQKPEISYWSRILMDPPNFLIRNAVYKAEIARSYAWYHPGRYLVTIDTDMAMTLGTMLLGTQYLMAGVGAASEAVDPGGKYSRDFMIFSVQNGPNGDEIISAGWRGLRHAALANRLRMARYSQAPSRIYSVQGDFGSIMQSGRIWGQTEGSVYGMAVPNAPRWRTFMDQKKNPGTFIFEDEAAALFKPHTVEGPFSGAKRLLGQYKSGFGDIIFDPKSVKYMSDNQVLIRNATLGPHMGQTTAMATRRLWTRRLVFEPLVPAGIGAGYYLLQHVVFDE